MHNKYYPGRSGSFVLSNTGKVENKVVAHPPAGNIDFIGKFLPSSDVAPIYGTATLLPYCLEGAEYALAS